MHNNNVIRVPPRRYKVMHKGMHGWVEYHPVTKTWTYQLKWTTLTTHTGSATTEADAVLELKTSIDTLISADASRMRTVD